MVAIATLIRDVLFFLKNDLSTNITDPIAGTRGTSGWVMTSYPQREVKYPLITIRLTNQEAVIAGMGTTTMDVTIYVEVRIWARNQKEKDELAQAVYDRLRSIQYSTGGSRDNDLVDFMLLSMNELDEPGDLPKSRILNVRYRFFNVT